jgi:U3 small nucleolar RNA-associated protein 14
MAGKGKKRSRQGGKKKAAGNVEKHVAKDVFSDEEDEQKEMRMNAQMDIDGVYEYEMPDKFDNDSEIDEDEAFNSEDEQAYGMFFNKNKQQQKKKQQQQAFYSDEEEEQQPDQEEPEEEESGDLLSDLLGTTPAKRLSTIDDEEEEEEGNFSKEEEEEEEDQDEKSKNLQSFVDGLVTTKEKKNKPIADILDDTPASDFAKSVFIEKEEEGPLTLNSLLGITGNKKKDQEEIKNLWDTTSQLNLVKIKKQLSELQKETAIPLEAKIAPILEQRASRKVAYMEKKKRCRNFSTNCSYKS